VSAQEAVAERTQSDVVRVQLELARPEVRVARDGVGKRLFDITFALVILALSAPILLVAMIAIRLETPGPALFRQRRMGLDGRIFELVKLRGMRTDARSAFRTSTTTRSIARRTRTASSSTRPATPA